GFKDLWEFKLDYTDADKVATWAEEPLKWMTMNKVINGMGDGTFNPTGSATRAQVAKVLMAYQGIAA
ncbi:MAG: S-layer homology domain-containing protein, partial [Oscillospiraceae bacterium]|nr:S-layer homology domain-containing protein [Oscillospiraceae bacterium]